MRKLLTREQYLDTIRSQNYTKYTNIPKSNEAFSNDVNWGDSLVGRLISSITRKVKISVNLRRIDSLVKRLNGLFDELLESGKIFCDALDKKFLTTLVNFNVLAEKINNKEELQDIIRHIDEMILQIESYNLESKDLLIEKLKEFRDFLASMKGDTEDEDTSTEADVNDKVKNVDILFNNLNLLKLVIQTSDLIENKPVVNTDAASGNIEVGKGAGYEKPELKTPNVAIYKNKKGLIGKGKILADQSRIKAGDIGLTTKMESNSIFEVAEFSVPKKNIINVVPLVKIGNKIEFSNKGVKLQGKVNKIENNILKITLSDNKPFQLDMSNTDFKVLESLINEGIQLDADGVTVFGKLKKSISILTNSKDKGLSIDVKWIDDILRNKTKEEVVNISISIYKTIYSYLMGDKKETLNPDKSKLLEGYIEDLSKKQISSNISNKAQVAGEKIARFSYTSLKLSDQTDPLSLTKGDVGLYKKLDKFGEALKNFNNSLSDILLFYKEGGEFAGSEKEKVEYKVGDVVKYKRDNDEVGEKEITKIEGDRFYFNSESGEELSKDLSDIISKNESIILRYNGYRLIREQVDYDKVEEKYNEVFDDKTKELFNITEEVKERLENIIKAQDSIVITNADPIIEIVRLFNRAWRIHTPGRIPSGRTNGKVSGSVFDEYENLGENSNGTPENPGTGPYRNIELYEKWQEAVLSILGNSKYKTTIFSDDAKFAFVSGERLKEQKISISTVGRKDNETKQEVPKPLGKILLRFMNNLLSNSMMYKDKGAMPKFLNEYFGLGGAELKELDYGGAFSNDSEENQKASQGIIQKKVEFVDISKLNETLDGSRNLLEFISSKVDGNDFDQIRGMVLRIKSTSDGKTLIRYFYLSDKETGSKLYFIISSTFFFDKTFMIGSNLPITDNNGKIYYALTKKTISDNSLEVSKKFKTIQTKDSLTGDSTDKIINSIIYSNYTIDSIEILVESEDKSIYTDAKIMSFYKKLIDRFMTNATIKKTLIQNLKNK